MPVTIDDAEIDAATLGLQTVGQVLSHAARDNRLVTQLLIDGQVPDLGLLDALRQEPVSDRTVFIETATALSLALDALEAMATETDNAQRLQSEAVDLLEKNDTTGALQRLGGCFTIWQSSRETVQKVAALMGIDLDGVMIRNTPLPAVMGKFGDQLRQLRSALEAGDFVLLMDVVGYEMADTVADWREIARLMTETLREQGEPMGQA
jgi:hypothetical protein